MTTTSSDPLVRLLADTFRTRSDRIVVATPRDLRRSILDARPLSIVDARELEHNLRLHVAGEKRVGFFNRRAPSGAPWGVIELDAGEHGDPDAADRDSLLLVRRFEAEGLTTYRERGRWGSGHFQIWIFVEGSVHSHEMRVLLEAIVERTAPETPTHTVPNASRGEGFGSFAWLPLFGGTDLWRGEGSDPRTGVGVPNDATVFVDETGQPIENQRELLLGLTRNSPEAVAAALSKMGVTVNANDAHTLATAHEPIPCDPESFYHLLGNCVRVQKLYERQRDEGLDPDEWHTVIRLLACLGDFGEREALAFARMGPTRPTGREETIIRECRGRYESGQAGAPTCADFGGSRCFADDDPLRFEDGKWRVLRDTDRETAPPPSPTWLLERSTQHSKDAARSTQPGTAAPSRAPIRVTVDPDESQAEGRVLGDLALLPSRLVSLTDPSAPDLGPALDRALGGGLMRGEVTLLTGQPGSGKTALCLQLASSIAHRAALERVHDEAWGAVVYLSPLESRRALTLRILSRLSGISLRKLMTVPMQDDERLQRASDTFEELSSYLNLVDLTRQTRDYFIPADLLEVIDEARSRVDAASVVLMIDPVQSLRTGREAVDAHPAHRLEAVAEELAALAQREDLAVMLVHEAGNGSHAPTWLARQAFRLELGGPSAEGLESDLSAMTGSLTAGNFEDATPEGRRAVLEPLRLSRAPLEKISLILDPTTGRFTEA